LGHKVHPNGFRLGVYRPWEANWFAEDKDYTKLLHEDLEMRRVILKRLHNAGIAKIETERSSNAQMTVTIHTAKPGIVIGKGGASVDQLREDLEKRFGNRVRISIQEIKQPELDAQLVAENIASQIERRISYRRAMKQSILRTMRSGAQGIRIALGGRLRGSEMARREWDREGRVPLHTLRANIEFGRATAKTTFGMIGVKVWIYKGLVKIAPRGGEGPAEIAPQPDAAVDGAEVASPELVTATTAPAAAPAATAAAAPTAPAPAAAPAATAVAEPVVEPVAEPVAEQPQAVAGAPEAEGLAEIAKKPATRRAKPVEPVEPAETPDASGGGSDASS
jgi:small subunit ribosomal protein S3